MMKEKDRQAKETVIQKDERDRKRKETARQKITYKRGRINEVILIIGGGI